MGRKRATGTFLALTVSAFFFVTAGSADVASAAQMVQATVDEQGILWIAAEVDRDYVGKLKTKIFSPKKNGGRKMQQVCVFAKSGPGLYSCGIEIGEGSFSGSLHGKWLGTVSDNTGRLLKTTISL